MAHKKRIMFTMFELVVEQSHGNKLWCDKNWN